MDQQISKEDKLILLELKEKLKKLKIKLDEGKEQYEKITKEQNLIIFTKDNNG